jgi:hypothetical protein
MEKMIIYVKGGDIINVVGTKNIQYKVIDYDINPEADEKDFDYLEPDTTVASNEIDGYMNC